MDSKLSNVLTLSYGILFHFSYALLALIQFGLNRELIILIAISSLSVSLPPLYLDLSFPWGTSGSSFSFT